MAEVTHRRRPWSAAPFQKRSTRNVVDILFLPSLAYCLFATHVYRHLLWLVVPSIARVVVEGPHVSTDLAATPGVSLCVAIFDPPLQFSIRHPHPLHAPFPHPLGPVASVISGGGVVVWTAVGWWRNSRPSFFSRSSRPVI